MKKLKIKQTASLGKNTVMKVVSKSIRTAMCIHGYFDNREAEIIFASPKINPKVSNDVKASVTDVQKITDSLGYRFTFKITANHDFKEQILYKVMNVSGNVADTSELFLRSYQMLRMFEDNDLAEDEPEEEYGDNTAVNEADRFSGMKVGEIAKNILRPMLEGGCASEEEILKMQTSEYSREIFHLKYPLLVKTGGGYETARYYSAPLKIKEKYYRLCNDWYEKKANNDRPFLVKWINEHSR